MGVDNDRVTFAWVSASEGNKWQEVVNETTARVKQLGPVAAAEEKGGAQ
jgi:coenzyme F420-reducing hydrogenase delta subunit